MDRLLVVRTRLAAHPEGAAGKVDHLQGLNLLAPAVLGNDDEAVAEGFVRLRR